MATPSKRKDAPAVEAKKGEPEEVTVTPSEIKVTSNNKLVIQDNTDAPKDATKKKVKEESRKLFGGITQTDRI